MEIVSGETNDGSARLVEIESEIVILVQTSAQLLDNEHYSKVGGRPRTRYVIGPDSSPLSIADLPTPGTKRWVVRRKAEVVARVRGGLLSLEEACSRYTLTVDEFLSWQRSIDQHGLVGLRCTRTQQYRQK